MKRLRLETLQSEVTAANLLAQHEPGEILELFHLHQRAWFERLRGAARDAAE
jgi:hypothetical protein